jgi:hypothetical protein
MKERHLSSIKGLGVGGFKIFINPPQQPTILEDPQQPTILDDPQQHSEPTIDDVTPLHYSSREAILQIIIEKVTELWNSWIRSGQPSPVKNQYGSKLVFLEILKKV